MHATFPPRPRIAVVTTRELGLHAGRPSILLNIIMALGQRHNVQVIRLRTVTETGSAGELAGTMLAWLRSWVNGHPLPLQCLLYAAPKECARVAAEIRDGGFNAVYLDTVRCQMLLRRLQRLRPQPHIVTDFDDLMSRRAEHLAASRMPLVTGHVSPFLPKWLCTLVEKPLAQLITRYEAATLVHSEREAIRRSDAVVLLSAVERRVLRARLSRKQRELIYAIPPAIDIHAAPWADGAPLRFVFIGSDQFLQNRRSIERLLEKWRALRPTTPLHIYGEQTHKTDGVPGVHWHGFAPDLAEVYRPGSIALVPAVVAGGVKTKVAEAWAWGCPVLGNDQAFEGYALNGYPLMLPDAQWDPFILCPNAYRTQWANAARLGHNFVRRNLSMDAFTHAWELIMRPVTPAAQTASPFFGEPVADFEAD